MNDLLGSLELSRQEERLLILSMSGLGDKEIAAKLDITLGTTRTYWQRIRQKVGGQTRAQLIATLVQQGAKTRLEAKTVENELLVCEIAKRKEAEQTFRAMADAAPIGVFRCSIEGRCNYVNPAWERIAGMDSAEAVGDGWHRVIHPDDAHKLHSQWADCVANRETLVAQIRFRRNDGSIAWVEVITTEMRVDEGLLGYVGTIQDITEARESQERVKSSEERFRAALKVVDEGILLIDQKGRIEALNPSAQRILGVEGIDVVGRLLAEAPWKAIRPDGSEFTSNDWPIFRSIKAEPMRNCEMRIERADGRTVWIRVNSEPIFLSGSKLPGGAVASFIDITADVLRREQFVHLAA